MAPVAEYVVGSGIALAIFHTAVSALVWAVLGRPFWPFKGLARRVEDARERRRLPSEPMPTVLLGLELRRLGAEVQRVDASDQPAKAMRLRACTAAYDYVLLECCRSMEVPVPGTATPLTPAQRFNAESSLVEAGFTW